MWGYPEVCPGRCELPTRPSASVPGHTHSSPASFHFLFITFFFSFFFFLDYTVYFFLFLILLY